MIAPTLLTPAGVRAPARRRLPILRVALNGFGRVGRAFVRAYRVRHPRLVELVAINDPAEPETLAHLFAHDSRHGRWPELVEPGLGTVRIGDDRFELLRQVDPAGLPWGQLAIDLVIDATGRHRTRALAERHRLAGAERVIVSAPMADADTTFVYGVNHSTYDPRHHHVISNASCTAHALAPIVSVLDRAFGWVRGFFTTVHPVTADQTVVDRPHADPRRGRSALAAGIIPTTSSAVDAVREVLPETGATLDGLAYRVPSPHPAVVDLVAQLRQPATVSRLADAFSAARDTLPPGVLGVEEQSLVASDYVGDIHSATIDAPLLSVTDGHQVHVTAWYDNEAGYAHRLLDLVGHLAETGASARARDIAPPAPLA